MATRTAAQERRDNQSAFDAFLEDCPTRQVFGVLSSKWVGLVMSLLWLRPARYAEIQREIAGVSPKMLTQTLRTLERDGLVERTVTAQVPVRVDYSLTPLGQDLAPVLRSLKVWAEAHIDEIHDARERYDTHTLTAGSGS